MAIKNNKTFPNPLKVERIGDEWQLVSDFVMISRKYHITVRKGFQTDFASIPRLLWILYPPWGSSYIKGSVIHDALYGCQLISRYDADLILYEAMRISKANKFRCYAFFYSLRLFGGFAWRSKSSRRIELNRQFVEIKKG